MDNIEGIFDDLSPEDFARKTSAVMEDARTQEDRTFDDFINDQLRAVRYAFASADGQVNPLATLANDRIERVFSADDDELLKDFVARLNREAQDMHATWLFIFRTTTVGVFASDTALDADSPEAKLAVEAEAKHEAIYWYAEDRNSEVTWRRHGFLTIEDNRLGEVFEGNSMQKMALFGNILG